MHVILGILAGIGLFWWFSDNPGAFKRIVILFLIFVTWFNVSTLWSRPTVSLIDLIWALLQPTIIVVGCWVIFTWIKTGKLP